MLVDQRLSPHFMLSEFVRSEIAAREGIDNTPPEEMLPQLHRNAAGMEQVRSHLNSQAPVGLVVGIHISSGYRCEALERILCAKDFANWCQLHRQNPATAWPAYFARKRHPRCLATDFTAPAFGTPAEICRALAASAIGFDQLIFEHTWVHVGWPELAAPPRREILTLVAGGYAPGIVEVA